MSTPTPHALPAGGEAPAFALHGTPTFFIDGVRFDGSWEPDALVAALEAAAGRHPARSRG